MPSSSRPKLSSDEHLDNSETRHDESRENWSVDS